MTTGTPSATAQTPPSSDLRAALARMKNGQRTHPAPSFEDRLKALERLESAVLARRGAIADAISRDFGHRASQESLLGEVLVIVSSIRHTKAHLREWMEPEDREVVWYLLPATARIVAQPVGVVGIISPWNYPVNLALVPLASAIAAGNRAMIKPSELVPETSALLRDLVAAVFSEDEVRVITGGPDVGEAFSRLPFDHLFFTGSTRVGKLVMRAASENLVPVTLELGGKSPAIVGAGCSIRSAADRILLGKLFSAGQTCIAPDYVLLPAGQVDAFVEACKASVAKMYPTLANNPDFTSICTDDHVRRLQRYVDDARAKGARIVEINPAGESLEGTRKVAPKLVLDVTDEMLVASEEIFGPILPLVPYRSLDEAIAYVNDRARPLALYYFGHDKKETDRVLAETTAGGVTLNETLLHFMQDDLPFGGIGPSGMGHYHGREGFQIFTKKKPILQQSRVSARALLGPPYGKMADRILRLLLR